MTIRDYSDYELQAELKRRAENKRPIPQPLASIDWNLVEEHAINAVEYVSETSGELPKALEAMLFESVMEAVYGPEIWDWWKDNIKD